MKIAAIEITHHRLPLDPPFRPSWDFRPRENFDATIVRVRTDEGLEGIGSGDTMTGFAGHEHLFVGRDPLDLERHNRILDNIQFHYGRCWPLDLALWDLAGKIKGEPVWKLLGGRRDRVPAYASSATLRDSGRHGRGGGALSGARLPRHEGALPPRRLARRYRGARSGARPRRRPAGADGRLQSGLAHEPRRRDAVDLRPGAARGARAGAARHLLDGGAAAPQRPQGHAAPARRRPASGSPAAR